MSFDFPNAPTNGQVFAPTGGPVYVYTGGVWRMQGSGQVVTAEARNRIVNPCFQISQENGSTASAVTASNASYFAADQWNTFWSCSPASIQARRDPLISPNGSQYANVIGVGATKASLAAGDYVLLAQNIEGIRAADFGWGTASAKQIVVRFWFKGTVTGKFSFKLTNSTRSYVKQFDYTTANAWQMITAVVPGDTAGTWATGAVLGIGFAIGIAVGSTYTGSTVDAWQGTDMSAGPGQTNGLAAANTFQVADVGLYLDPNATGVPPPWQMPDEAQELLTCKRYYYKSDPSAVLWYGYAATSGQAYAAPVVFPVEMRAVPAYTEHSATVTNFPGGSMASSMSFRNGYAWRGSSAAGYGNFLNGFIVNARM